MGDPIWQQEYTDSPQNPTIKPANTQSERRIVTILFCDVTGSTAMAEHLDPEEWAEIMNEAFQYLIKPVNRYAGTIARLMGDGILAFFGAPLAHEDDPQRAILAGLEIIHEIRTFGERIRQDYGFDFNVRVGINTGMVVVGAIGSNTAAEYTAMGDAVNVAARMEQTAEPGSVQITEFTYRRVAPLFDVEPLGPIQVKGKQQSVPAYRVLRQKTRPGNLRGIQGLSAPLIGRDPEMVKLEKAIQFLMEGRGQIIFLIGEAGLGKSRLIEEIHSQWRKLVPREENWFESHGVPFDMERPYGLFNQLQSCITRTVEEAIEALEPGISGEEPQENPSNDRIEFLTAQLEQMTDLGAEFYAHEAGDESMLSSSQAQEGKARKRRLFEGTFKVWHSFAEHSPTILIFDDLHWADPASVELLQFLFSLVSHVPVLFICATRPYRHSPGWNALIKAQTDFPHRYTEVNLSPLTNEDSSALIDSLLTIAELPANLRSLLLSKSEGNPFFVEEVIRTLIDNGALVYNQDDRHWRVTKKLEDLSIPDNLQSLIISRIDRLESQTRTTLQMSAVIGRSFFYRILEYIADSVPYLEQQIETLQRVDLIREKERLPEVEYIFRHELTRDAAYETILHRDRRRYHRRAAQAIEAVFPDQLARLSGRLAYHYVEAGDMQMAQKYSIMAGEEAARVYAYSEAIANFSRALDIAQQAQPPEPELLTYLFRRRGRIYELSSQHDLALLDYQTLQDFGIKLGKQSLVLSGLLAQALIYSTPSTKQDAEKAQTIVDVCLDLAIKLQDHSAEAQALWIKVLIANYNNQTTSEVITAGNASVRLARQFNLQEQLAYSLHDTARSYMSLGQLKTAWVMLDEASQIWREINNKEMLVDSMVTKAFSYYVAGIIHESSTLSQEAYEISKAIGNVWGQAYSLGALGPTYLEMGNFDDGIRTLERSISLSKEANFTGSRFFSRVILSWIFNYLGDAQRSESYLAELFNTEESPDIYGYYKPIFNLHEALIHQDASLIRSIIANLDKRYFERVFDNYFGSLVCELIGRAALYIKDYSRVLDLADKALPFIQEYGTRLFLPDVLHIKGLAQIGLGQENEGCQTIEDARLEAIRQDSSRALLPILASQMRIAIKDGDQVEIESLQKKARQLIDHYTVHISDAEILSRFLNLEDVLILLTDENSHNPGFHHGNP